VQALADLSGLRLTVDYADDLDVVRELVAMLAPREDFDLYDMLRAIAHHPHRLQRNAHARNEGLDTSLAQERTDE
jgi:spore coat polysaccharide biosynthesis protein SpsF (cytidylyltransferase family)